MRCSRPVSTYVAYKLIMLQWKFEGGCGTACRSPDADSLKGLLSAATYPSVIIARPMRCIYIYIFT